MAEQGGARRVMFGVDRLLAGEVDEFPKTGRLGMVTSDAATCAAAPDKPSRVALRDSGFNLVRLFGPEHGLGAAAADGDKIADAADPLTGLPVVSLYGKKTRPSPVELADLDAVLFDIPDVGARFYTYIWTLSHVLEACGETNRPLFVLDRANPIGGDMAAAEGPVLDEASISSFVGRWAMPIRHCATVGELAALWNVERKIGAALRVITCSGWDRADHWPALGVPFVRPSPNMRDYEAALLYPGTCLIEGTTVSEGRGTDAAFKLIGAPWIDGEELTDELTSRQLPGLRIEPATFTPDSRKHANERCGGVRFTVTDAPAVRPVAAGLHLIDAIIRRWPSKFEWRGSFDRLVGRSDIRPALTEGVADIAAQIRAWTDPGDWAQRIHPHLRYA